MTSPKQPPPGRVSGGVCGARTTLSRSGKRTPRLNQTVPASVTNLWGWQLRGACREVGGSLFFRPDREQPQSRARREAQAKQICAGCPVLWQCRRHTLAVREPHGVWGGLTELDRHALIHSRT